MFTVQGSSSLTPAIHPQGQCCKTTFTKKEKLSGHKNVLIGYQIDKLNISYEEFRVFLTNRKISTYFNLNNFNMDSRLGKL